MSFVSLEFFVCLAVAGTLFYAVPARWRTHYLLGVSYLFYATWDWAYLALLILITALVFFAGRSIAGAASERGKGIRLWSAVGAMVALVTAFKLLGRIDGLLFPLGLSYYSFKLIAYLIDVYWDENAVETDAATFFLYPAFFPQIVSGPIQRADDFFAQWRRQGLGPADYGRIESGFRYIVGGLLLKSLIGDRLGAFIATVDQSPGSYRYAVILLLLCCYTLQLYADFAGYTNIAIGIGKVFNIDSPPNFAAPFAATNIQEMWRRWHMSLTSWVTDYLFMPMQMALRGLGRLGMVMCITLSMVVIGLWHNITLSFLVFGLCHAVFVSVTALTAKGRARVFNGTASTRRLGAALGVVLTFCLMTFSQVFWRTGHWSGAVTRLKLLLGLTKPGHIGLSAIRFDVADPVFACMAIALFVGAGAPGLQWLARRVDRTVPVWAQLGACLLLLSAFSSESSGSFIYGQF